MESPGYPGPGVPTRLIKTSARIAGLLIAVVSAIWIYRAYLARNLPDLQVWHSYELESEFRAQDYPDGLSLQQYIELESHLFEELESVVYKEQRSVGRFNRYNTESEAYAGDAGQRWNRSFELQHEQARGGVVFIHGASDSPYSTLAISKILNDSGMYVLSIRLPGNGTIPSGLRHAKLDDWLAITRMAAKHVRETIGPDLPLYMAGYSIGGALIVDYALDATNDETLAAPDRLFLYTPAIGVSAAARFSSWDLALAKLRPFEKFNWLSIEPEFDPYKYNSFAKNAGHITYQLTMQLNDKLSRLEDPMALPPIIAFQSLVDSTIRVDALVNGLYERLGANGSELVLFDINRANDIEHFIKNSELALVTQLAQSEPNAYTYTLVTNINGESTDVVERTKVVGDNGFDDAPLGLSWPDSIYSLSHVSLVFESTDRWYGSEKTDSFTLGTLAPRGETAILRPPVGRFMRLRHNPFFDYLSARTLAFCEACLKPDGIEASLSP